MIQPAASGTYRAYILFVLVVVYTFNFIDRQIVSILAVPIKSELNLSDTQLSLMGGLAFALFYTLLGIPIARLADRFSRTWIMTVALALWSAMTMVCGVAQNFVQLFLARLGVGVGEAGGVAPAYALIADYFPSRQRARALSIFSLGIPIGGALGVILGGVLSELMSWRAAFMIVGAAGLLIAPIFRLTVREPERGQFDQGFAKLEPTTFKQVLTKLAGKPSFWLLCFGAASSSMIGYALIFWLPSFLVRSFADDLPTLFTWMPEILIPHGAGPTLYASYFYGSIMLTGGMLGIWLGGVLADYFGPKRKQAYALIPALGFLLCIPFFLFGILSNTIGITFAAFIVPTALSLAWLGPALSVFQHLVPPNMRATASALFLFINNLIGLGLGNLVIGAMSDFLYQRYQEESLRYALMSGVLFYFLAMVFFLLASKHIQNDWEPGYD